MKTSDFRSLAHEIASRLPGFSVGKKMIFQVPVGRVLRALIFDSSGFDSKAFYPTAFVQPLYIPTTHLNFLLSVRLPGQWDYSKESEESLADRLSRSLNELGDPLFEALRTEEAIAKNGSQFGSEKDPHLREAIAYSLAISGRTAKAISYLNSLTDMLCESKSSLWTTHKEKADLLIASLLQEPMPKSAREPLVVEIECEYSAALKALGGHEALVNSLGRLGKQRDPHIQMAIALSLIRVGRDQEAIPWLRSFSNAARKLGRVEPPPVWITEMSTRAIKLRKALESNHREAMKLLESWEDFTRSRLRLLE